MIKSYNNFIEESVRNEMTPKSDKEVRIALENKLKELKKLSEEPKNDWVSDELKHCLEIVYFDRKKLICDLIDEGLDPDDLLVMITDDIMKAEKDREIKYRLKVQKWMYNLIEKNKDKLDLDELSR